MCYATVRPLICDDSLRMITSIYFQLPLCYRKSNEKGFLNYFAKRNFFTLYLLKKSELSRVHVSKIFVVLDKYLPEVLKGFYCSQLWNKIKDVASYILMMEKFVFYDKVLSIYVCLYLILTSIICCIFLLCNNNFAQ